MGLFNQYSDFLSGVQMQIMHTVSRSEYPAEKVAIPAFALTMCSPKPIIKKKDRLKMDKEIK